MGLEKVFDLAERDEMRANINSSLSDIVQTTSITEDIERLCAPSIDPFEESLLVANVVLKYFTLFYTPRNVNEKIPSIDVSDSIASFSLNGATTHPDTHYQLTMLGDFPSTICIMQDIIGRKIERKENTKGYLGIDVGSGSGILMVAQYILSRREGIANPLIVGVEKNKWAIDDSNILLKNLGIGKVYYGDTTKAWAYRKFSERVPFCITNENIPNPNGPMENEPYFKAICAIGEALGLDALSKSEHFPSSLILHGESSYVEFDPKKDSHLIVPKERIDNWRNRFSKMIKNERLESYERMKPFGIGLVCPNPEKLALEKVGEWLKGSFSFPYHARWDALR